MVKAKAVQVCLSRALRIEQSCYYSAPGIEHPTLWTATTWGGVKACGVEQWDAREALLLCSRRTVTEVASGGAPPADGAVK